MKIELSDRYKSDKWKIFFFMSLKANRSDEIIVTVTNGIIRAPLDIQIAPNSQDEYFVAEWIKSPKLSPITEQTAKILRIYFVN